MIDDAEEVLRRLKTHFTDDMAEAWMDAPWFAGRSAHELIEDGFADEVYRALDVLFGVGR